MDESAGASRSSATIDPPQGWTVDPDDLDVEFYWNSPTAPGMIVASQYRLSDPTPLMCTDSSSGTPLYMFSSGEKLYFWNLIEGDVWKVKTPGSAQDIAKQIVNGGLKSLELEKP